MRVLVVIDCQKGYVENSFAAKSLIPHMKECIKEYADGETLILFTKNALHHPHGTSGWSLVKEISTLADGYSNFLIYSDGEIIRSRVVKEGYGSAKLMEILKKNEDGIDEIIFMGFHTDTSVITNALTAKTLMPDVKVGIHADCCVGTTLENHLAALKIMKNCYIDITY